MPTVAANVAVLAPAATFAEAGTLNAVVLLESDTVVPPEGAAWLSVTVHVAELPEPSVLGLQASDESDTGGTSEMDAVCDAPFNVAVMTAV